MDQQRKKGRQASLGVKPTGGKGTLTLRIDTLAEEMEELRKTGVLSSAEKSREFVREAKARGSRARGYRPPRAGKVFNLAGRGNSWKSRLGDPSPVPKPHSSVVDSPLSRDCNFNLTATDSRSVSHAVGHSSGACGSGDPSKDNDRAWSPIGQEFFKYKGGLVLRFQMNPRQMNIGHPIRVVQLVPVEHLQIISIIKDLIISPVHPRVPLRLRVRENPPQTRVL